MADERSILNVPGIGTTGRKERERLLEICSRNKWDADYLAAAISHESGWRPTAKNPGSTATGLMQWTNAGAKAIGTTPAEISRLSVYEQLLLVERYFQRASYGRRIQPTDFLVYALGAERCIPQLRDSCILYPAGSAGALANPALQDRDGAIRVRRMRRELAQMVGAARARDPLPVAIERDWSTYGGPGNGTTGPVFALLAAAVGLVLVLPRLLRYVRR